MFPLEKYKYFTNNKDTVVAQSTYAGKKYRGIATCTKPDEFNLEIGKKIAAYKCNKKICEKRVKDAEYELSALYKLQSILNAHISEQYEYCKSAKEQFVEATSKLNETLRESGAID